MSTTWQTWLGLFDAALNGMAQPWLVCGALVLSTFVLEDLAIAAAAALAVQGSLSWELAFAAVGGGIALGDLGLYGLGLAAKRVAFLHRRLIEGRSSAWVRDQLQGRLGSSVLLARVVPGLRFVSYTACGFFSLPFWPFFSWVVLAVALWTGGLLWLSVVFGAVLARVWGIPAPLAVAVPIIALALGLALLRRARGMGARGLV